MNTYEKVAEEAGASPAIATIILLKETAICIHIHAFYPLYP
jgi:hypothetical protein